MVWHGFVPDSFAIGVIIPLLKDKSGNINDVDNYRALTLSPIISKVFELLLLSMCHDVLETDMLQFGFKRNSGCMDAIFTPKSVIQHFSRNGGQGRIKTLGAPCQRVVGAFPFPPLPSRPFPLPSSLSLSPPSRPLLCPLSSSSLLSLRSRLLKIWGLGERCKFPQWGLGRSPSRRTIWCIFESKGATLVAADFLWSFSQ